MPHTSRVEGAMLLLAGHPGTYSESTCPYVTDHKSRTLWSQVCRHAQEAELRVPCCWRAECMHAGMHTVVPLGVLLGGLMSAGLPRTTVSICPPAMLRSGQFAQHRAHPPLMGLWRKLAKACRNAAHRIDVLPASVQRVIVTRRRCAASKSIATSAATLQHLPIVQRPAGLTHRDRPSTSCHSVSRMRLSFIVPSSSSQALPAPFPFRQRGAPPCASCFAVPSALDCFLPDHPYVAWTVRLPVAPRTTVCSCELFACFSSPFFHSPMPFLPVVVAVTPSCASILQLSTH